jgi:hypothetical protein
VHTSEETGLGRAQHRHAAWCGDLERRDPEQQGVYLPVDPQPKVMVPVIDEADPHANQRDSTSVQYGVLYCLREDNVMDKDAFWYQPQMKDGVWTPVGQRYRWGVVGEDRWNIEHALNGLNFGVKMFRIRRGG